MKKCIFFIFIVQYNMYLRFIIVLRDILLTTYPNECFLLQRKYQLLFEYFHNIAATDSITHPPIIHLLHCTVIILYWAYCSRVSLGTKQTDDGCINTRLSYKLLTMHVPACMHYLPPIPPKVQYNSVLQHISVASTHLKRSHKCRHGYIVLCL